MQPYKRRRWKAQDKACLLLPPQVDPHVSACEEDERPLVNPHVYACKEENALRMSRRRGRDEESISPPNAVPVVGAESRFETRGCATALIGCSAVEAQSLAHDARRRGIRWVPYTPRVQERAACVESWDASDIAQAIECALSEFEEARAR